MSRIPLLLKIRDFQSFHICLNIIPAATTRPNVMAEICRSKHANIELLHRSRTLLCLHYLQAERTALTQIKKKGFLIRSCPSYNVSTKVIGRVSMDFYEKWSTKRYTHNYSNAPVLPFSNRTMLAILTPLRVFDPESIAICASQSCPLFRFHQIAKLLDFFY